MSESRHARTDETKTLPNSMKEMHINKVFGDTLHAVAEGETVAMQERK